MNAKNWIAALLGAVALNAQALPSLYIDAPVATDPIAAGPHSYIFDGYTALVSNVYVTEAATLTYEYVFKEAGFNNRFFADQPAAIFSTGSSVFGDTYTTTTSAGLLDFGFGLNSAIRSLDNGFNPATEPNFGIPVLPGSSLSAPITFGSSIYVLLNDGGAGNDADWDDMVIKISVSAVPEPGEWAMMLAGLAMLAVVARRRARIA